MSAFLLTCLAAFAVQEPTSPTVVGWVGGVDRIEHFVIERADRSGSPLGTARHIGRTRDGALDLELDTRWVELDTRVLWTEVVREQGPVLVWREWGEAGARTFTVERDEGERLTSVQWDGTSVLREPLPPRGDADRATPLRLLEVLRTELPRGLVHEQAVEVLNPLSGTFEPSSVRTRRIAPLAGLGLRLVSRRRADGSLAERHLLLGTCLLAYQGQPGGPVARRCAPVRYEGLALARRAAGGSPAAGVTHLLPASTGTLR